VNAQGVKVPSISFREGASVYVRASLYENNFHLGTRDSGENLNGGFLLFDLPSPGNGSAYLGFWTPTTLYYHQVGSSGDHRFMGKFGPNESLSGGSALYCGSASGFGGGPYTTTISYTSTMISNAQPLVTVVSTNNTGFTWHAYSRSASGFTVFVGAGAGSSTEIMYWSFRT
jgi:hypothetical protein